MREQARLYRDRMTVDQSDFERVIDVFFEEVNPLSDQVIALYWPYGKEFDCLFLLDELVKRGYVCGLPCIQKDSRVMVFKQWTHETKMSKGAFGISEPSDSKVLEPNMIIAPLLAFDQKGYRLGQGGGYYDATLEAIKAQKEVTFMGIGFAEQAVLLKLPREEHDIPLDAMLTPQGLIEF